MLRIRSTRSLRPSAYAAVTAAVSAPSLLHSVSRAASAIPSVAASCTRSFTHRASFAIYASSAPLHASFKREADVRAAATAESSKRWEEENATGSSAAYFANPSASSTSRRSSPLRAASRHFLSASRDAWLSDTIILSSPALKQHIGSMRAALDAENVTNVFGEFQRMKADVSVERLHVEAFNILLAACVKLKQPEASVMHANCGSELRVRKRQQPTHQWLTSLYHALVSLCSAVATFDSIFEHGLQPDFWTYELLIDATLDHTDLRLSFDFLSLLFRQLDSASEDLRRCSAAPLHSGWWSGPSPGCTSAEWRLHGRLAQVVAKVLEKLSYIAQGYSGASAVAASVRTMERQAAGYLNKAAAAWRSELLADPKQTPHTVSSALSHLDHAGVAFLYNSAIEANLALLSHAISRNKLVNAAHIWESLQELYTSPRFKPWSDARHTLREESRTIHQYMRAITSAVKVQHSLRLQNEQEWVDEDAQASAAFRADDRTLPATHPLREVAGWQELTWQLYGQLWRYVQHLMLAKKVQQQHLQGNEAEKDVFQLAAMLGSSADSASSSEGHGSFSMVSESQLVSILRAHSSEDAAESAANTTANAQYDAMESEARLRGIEGDSPSEQLAAQEEASAPQDESVELNRARSEITSALSSSSGTSTAPARPFRGKKNASSHPARPRASGDNSESDLLDSLKTIFPSPALSASSESDLNFLYFKLMSVLLLYGGVSSSRSVTSRSYQRNRERIHAIYYDYLSLGLSSPDQRIFLLSHLASAPSEFHSNLLRDGFGSGRASPGTPSSIPDLFGELFGASFRSEPHRAVERVWRVPGVSVRAAEEKDAGEWQQQREREWEGERREVDSRDREQPRGERDEYALDFAKTFTAGSSASSVSDPTPSAPLRTRAPFTLTHLPRSTVPSSSWENAGTRFAQFQSHWHMAHVAGNFGSGSEFTDLQFRRRTYRLIEELARRGVALHGPKNGMLSLLFRSLCFTSYASRFDPAAPEGDPASRNILALPFEERRTTVYPSYLSHVKRVLRVLFGMMVSSGIYPDVATMHVLIAACLRHKRYGEAGTVLHHMRHTFFLTPTAETLALFTKGKSTTRNGFWAYKNASDLEQALSEHAPFLPGNSTAAASGIVGPDAPSNRSMRARMGLLRRRNVGAEQVVDRDTFGREFRTEAGLLAPRQQELAMFNQLLDQYRYMGDAGDSMYRLHERLFELGLQPDARTLALSLHIILQPDNMNAYKTALELLNHATSSHPFAPESTGALSQFVEAIHTKRQTARDAAEGRAQRKEAKEEADTTAMLAKERAERRRLAIIKFAEMQRRARHAFAGEAATTVASISVDTDASVAPGTNIPFEPVPFDPMASSAGASFAIPFSYESWFGIRADESSWGAVILAAAGQGQWDDTYHLFQRMLLSLAHPGSSRDISLFLTEKRWRIFAAVLKTLLGSSNRPQAEQAWYLNRVLDQMSHFWSGTDPDAVVPPGERAPLLFFSLHHPNLSWYLLPKQVQRLQAMETKLRSIKPQCPPSEYDEETNEPPYDIMLPTAENQREFVWRARAERQEGRQRRLKAEAQEEQHASKQHTRSTSAEDDDMAFL